jgi:hypothetical protein
VRNTGPVEIPVTLSATKKGLVIGFAQALDRELAASADSYSIKAWDLKRSSNYGSKHINERDLEIKSAELSPDGKSVLLQVDNLDVTWGMLINIRVSTADGKRISCEINNTIHALKK